MATGTVMGDVEVLRIQAAAIGAVQESLLRLQCQLMQAMWDAEAGELEQWERDRLLRAAREYLGSSVREVA